MSASSPDDLEGFQPDIDLDLDFDGYLCPPKYGFKRAEIYDFLAKHGLSLDRGKSGSPGDSEQEIADAGDRDDLREQVATLKAEASERSGLLDAANTRIQELSADLAQGKSRTTMAKVIAAAAKDAYAVDIHAPRMSNFGEMLAALQAAGADVKEDALRGYVKEGAALLGKADTR
jgi:hypothetical protein